MSGRRHRSAGCGRSRCHAGKPVTTFLALGVTLGCPAPSSASTTPWQRVINTSTTIVTFLMDPQQPEPRHGRDADQVQ
ncbi:hypothetical protein B5U98_08175 [Bosea sp. Tri-39]|nr:hypothetical protein B5U98_08175 [Bosea sp. Tri-39]RXT42446.1 hypothetical protein B5U99_00645 [Bosea sp. Tri-54]